MPTIDSVSSSTATYGATTVTPKKTALGADDFMKLLAVQFQSQDPMKPQEDTAFISQMAQFTSLDQSSSLVKEMGLLRADQQNLSASNLLGRNVTVNDTNNLPVTGQVTAIQSSADGPILQIGGQSYPLSSVQRVEYTPPPATSTTSTTASLTPAA